MKKNIFSIIGTGGAALLLVVSLTFTSHKSEASQLATINIKAMLSESPGACTGPKNQTTYVCECSNTNPCSDTQGCTGSSLDD